MKKKCLLFVLIITLSLMMWGDTASYRYISERYDSSLKLTLFNTKYEQLTCVGLYPDKDQLEAVIAIKQPYGYRGAPCHGGSKEYVAFYIDEGSGFASAGAPAAVQVYDLAAAATEPVYYAVRKAFTPDELKGCQTPQVIKVRAILSWQTIPTGPNFIPHWGNVMETWVQIRPKPRLIVKIPQFHEEIIKLKPPFIFKTPILSVAPGLKPHLDKLSLRRPKPVVTAEIESARNDFDKLISANPNHFGMISQSKDPIIIKEAIAAMPQSKIKETLLVKLPVELIPVLPIAFNTGFEELACVGLHPEEDLLEAVIEIKRPSGYGGDLCKPGSKEYVAFYIDWGSGFVHEDTVSVKVHDIPEATTKEIHYAVEAKIKDIEKKLNGCKENVVKVRAILSWNSDPTPYGANVTPTWGNVLTRQVQIRPEEDPISQCKITIVNEIFRQHIDSNGFAVAMDIPAPYVYDRPFGGYIVCKGELIAAARYYRFSYSEDNGSNWVTIKDKRRAVNVSAIPGALPYKEIAPVDDDGWFDRAAYDADKGNYESTALIYWLSHGRNGKYLLRLEVADAAKNVIPGQSDELVLMLDNTSPVFYQFTNPYNDNPLIGIALRKPGQLDPYKCGEFSGNDQVEVLGNFYDAHFDNFGLAIFGGNIPHSGIQVSSGPPHPAINQTGTQTAYNYPPANLISVLATVDITNVSPPMIRCAYFFRLTVWDKAIVGSVSGYQFSSYRHWNTADVTFFWIP